MRIDDLGSAVGCLGPVGNAIVIECPSVPTVRRIFPTAASISACVGALAPLGGAAGSDKVLKLECSWELRFGTLASPGYVLPYISEARLDSLPIPAFGILHLLKFRRLHHLSERTTGSITDRA
jgi:hypothetical protein